MDKKFEAFLQEQMKRLGLINIIYRGVNPLPDNGESVQFGKVDENTWVVQYGYSNGIDDCVDVQAYLSKEPDQNTICEIKAFEKIYLNRKYINPYFYCDYCGKRTHIADIKGDKLSDIERLFYNRECSEDNCMPEERYEVDSSISFDLSDLFDS